MNISIPIPEQEATTADLIRRLGLILAGLAGLIAARFLRRPTLVRWILPLWKRLTQVGSRVERAVARPTRVRVARPGRKGGGHGQRLPMGKGWLVRELGWEASGYRSQLEHLLAEPGMQALMAQVPGVGRVLRPVCRMLGAVVAAPVAAVAARSEPEVAAWTRLEPKGAVGVVGDCEVFATSA